MDFLDELETDEGIEGIGAIEVGLGPLELGMAGVLRSGKVGDQPVTIGCHRLP